MFRSIRVEWQEANIWEAAKDFNSLVKYRNWVIHHDVSVLLYILYISIYKNNKENQFSFYRCLLTFNRNLFQNDLSEVIMRKMAKDVGSYCHLLFHDISSNRNIAWKQER